jgi:signal transduction histidine kinase
MSDGQVGVRVTDTGPGIPADELPAIFDRYQQASTASRSPIAGSGLGLALVRELTEVHGGRVEVESAEGRGTSFTVWLPTASPDEVAEASTNRAPAELPPGDLTALAAAGASTAPHRTLTEPTDRDDVPTVLVVDDNQNMLDFLHDLLSREYKVVCATDSAEALERLRTERPDIILSDVMMPGPDGIALCETLKRDESLRHIPVVLLTARASLESKVTGLEAGADDYITKPFHPEELHARVGALLRMRRIERELAASHERLTLAYSELRDTQAQLTQAEKMASLGTLVAGVAHEINNPVSFIKSSIDLITDSIVELRQMLEHHLRDDVADQLDLRALRKDLDYERRFRMLEQNAAICRDGAQRATRIVNDLRAFSRPGIGSPEPADLHEILDRSIRLLHGEAKGRVSVNRDYGECPLVVCDTGQIGQVFLNLLANGLQAIEGPGDLHVRTRRLDNRVEIEIEDSGRGMNEAEQARIFDPFFTTKQIGKGTGLGLSIARSLVKAHGGDIAVRSEPGQGSVFTVTLPIDGAPHE